MGSGPKVTISAEGYTYGTYMLVVSVLALRAKLAATSKWLKATAQEGSAKKKSLAFASTVSIRRKPSELRATLDGVEFPLQQEFKQMGIGVRTWPKRGIGTLHKKHIANGKTAMPKARVN